MIEVKHADDTVSAGLLYFQEKYQISGIQLVKELKRERLDKGIEIRSAGEYLKTLYL